MNIILTFVVKVTHFLYLSFHILSFNVKYHYGDGSESENLKHRSNCVILLFQQALNISESIIFIMMKNCP